MAIAGRSCRVVSAVAPARFVALRTAATAAGPNKLRLQLGAHCIPKSDEGAGEDAYFASPPLGAFGVADGVGSWTGEGVNAGLFSRALLQNIHGSLRQRAQRSAAARPDLPGVARSGFEAVRRDEIKGSCTLILAQLHLDMLTILNLGDCGIVAMRPVMIQSRFFGGTPEPAIRVVYRSSPMVHRPNMPFQLSSEDDDAEGTLSPYDLVSVRLQRGDLVVAGSDGLFDNMENAELEAIALKHQASSAPIDDLASAVAGRAAELARGPTPEVGLGGKLDDIAVVAAEATAWTPSVGGGLLENFEDAE